MNERIKELALQATTYIEPTATSGEGWIFNKEKFAELIIKECVDLVDTLNEAYDAPSTAGKFIKKHFGIEET